MASSFDPGSGKKLENYVFGLLARLGYVVHVGTLAEREIDFVAEKNQRKVYIQVVYLLADEMVVDREYAPLEKVADHWEKYVVSLDELHLDPRNGIKHVQAWRLHEIL